MGRVSGESNLKFLWAGWLVEEGASHYSMEISYNRFERTIELPCHLKSPRIALEGRNGLLIIRLTEG